MLTRAVTSIVRSTHSQFKAELAACTTVLHVEVRQRIIEVIFRIISNTTPSSCPRGLLSLDTRSRDGARVRASVGISFTKTSNLFVPVVSEVPSILIDLFPTVSFRKVVSLSQRASIVPTPENVLELEQEIDVS